VLQLEHPHQWTTNVRYLPPAVSNQQSLFTNPYYFTGRRLDVFENGFLKIQYNRNRYYNYSLGRWLTHDPLGIDPSGEIKNPFAILTQYRDAMNLYEYVKSNPVIYVYPCGLILTPPDSWSPTNPYSPLYPSNWEGGETRVLDQFLETLLNFVSPEDTRGPAPGQKECDEMEGYYKHCVAACRTNRYVTGSLLTYIAGLTAGRDWPWNEQRIDSASDRAANRAGIANAYKFWRSCRNLCADSARKQYKRICCD